jgi:hypothetical protein
MSFYKIQTVTLSSTQASIDFTNIPSYYDHLVILCNTRRDSASGTGSGSLVFNNNTSNNAYLSLQMSSSGFYSGSPSPSTQMYGFAPSKLEMFNCGNSTDTANSFPQNTIYIWNYSNKNYYKFTNSHGSQFNNSGYSYQSMYSGWWQSNETINSIKLISTSGANFIAGSTASLYGIKTTGESAAVVY